VQNLKSKVQGRVFAPIPNPQPPTHSPWIGRGQCVEQFGAGEAFLRGLCK